MALSESRRRFRPRDLLALSVWAVFAIALMLSPFDWSPVRQALTFKPKIKEAVAAPIVNTDELYTGSIVFVPPTGDFCWERLLDNRTGYMWDKGYVDCYETQPSTKARHPTMSGARMLAIGKALRGND